MNLSAPVSQQTFPRPFSEDYDLLGILGKGGMGYVYKALHKKLNREVALKILDASTSDEESVKRFRLEAQAMKELDHQNIVQVYDFGVHGKHFFIAMTYVKGSSLHHVLQNRKYLDFEAIELIAKQVARGLLYAHSKGIIHRDVKPSNIMITHDNRVYIMDFGISYIQETERLTMTGMTMGTPEYMSPEQCQGDNVTIQSDIYSFGVILYEMTCGRLPFTGAKPIEIALKHVREQPPALDNFRKGIPKGFSQIVLKCLKKNLPERFHDMQELLDALDSVFPRRLTQSGVKISAPDIKVPLRSFLHSGKKIPKKLILCAMFLFPLIVCLMLILMLTHKPVNVIQEIYPDEMLGVYETKNLEKDVKEGYPLKQIQDNELQTAWLFPAQPGSKNPFLTLRFEKPTLVTRLGIAVGYQKSLDDSFGDRFQIFNKPKTVTLKTKEGTSQKIVLENIKGIQYPDLKPMETVELQFFLNDSYRMNPETNTAISELRIIGMKF